MPKTLIGDLSVTPGSWLSQGSGHAGSTDTGLGASSSGAALPHANLRPAVLQPASALFRVIDLKIGEFKPEFAGKKSVYLSGADEQAPACR